MTTTPTTQRINVEAHSQDVTLEQMSKCVKIYDFNKGVWFYQVENDSNKFDEDENLITYRVEWSKEKGFTCGCESGKYGFWNVKHPSGVCKHVRWSVAAAREDHAECIEAAREKATVVAEHTLIINGKAAMDEEVERVVNAKPTKHQGARIRQAKAFSLLK